MKFGLLRLEIIFIVCSAILSAGYAVAQEHDARRDRATISKAKKHDAGGKLRKKGKRHATGTTSGAKRYIVKRGDTLSRIARSHGQTLSALVKANPGLDARRIKPGMAISVPASAYARKQNSGESPDAIDKLKIVYRVKKGETLYSVSRKFNLSEDEIKKLNKLNDDILIAGMPLQIRKLDDRRHRHADGDEQGYRLVDDEAADGEDGVSEVADVTGDGVAEAVNGEAAQIILPYSLTGDNVQKMLNYSLDYLGTTYKYGGSSVSAIDCSAFVKRVYREVSIDLPRTSREQYRLGMEVPMGELKEGDLLFFAKRNRINHVGMYIGNDMFIHAARRGKGVIVSRLDSPYVKKYFVGAKRMFQVADNPGATEESLRLTEKPLIN